MIENIKDLEKMLGICSKLGVTEITWGGVSCKIGTKPLTIKEIKEANAPEPTDEEMAFYAVDGN